MKIKAFALFSAAAFLSLTGPTSSRMDDGAAVIANRYLSNPGNTGIAIAIISGGEEKIYCFGNSNKATGDVIDSNSLFEIGSITKVFTGIMLADEVVKGNMQLTDNIAQYLPVKSDAAKQVNMMQLSTHSSGVPRLADNFWPSVKDDKNPYASYGEKDLYSFIDNMKLRTEPGTHYSYSNVGTGILGNILCRQNETSYEALVKEKVCAPCGMTNTTITLSDVDKAHLATGYSKGEAVRSWDFQDATAGQGALRSNIKDMMSFMRYNLKPEGQLKQAMQLAAQTHFTDGKSGQRMGLGWHLGSFYGEHYLEHTGGTGGYRSFIGLVPGTNTGVVVLSNSDNDVAAIGIELLKMAAEHEKEIRKTIVSN